MGEPAPHGAPAAIDYGTASATYDNTRGVDDGLIDCFARRVAFSPSTSVLDFGCGTGNFLQRMRQRFACRCCGVEPSAEMAGRARAKDAEIDVRSGNHAQVPFADEYFDFAFMTDVVHHVPNRRVMFSELRRVLKPGGRLCVVTESHAQIDGRFYNRYFPSLAANEKRRYPDLPQILRDADEAGLMASQVETRHGPATRFITEAWMRNVREKNYSMFRLLEPQEFARGLADLQADVGRACASAGGESLLWWRRE